MLAMSAIEREKGNRATFSPPPSLCHYPLEALCKKASGEEREALDYWKVKVIKLTKMIKKTAYGWG